MQKEIAHALEVQKTRDDGYRVISILIEPIDYGALGLFFEEEPVGLKYRVRLAPGAGGRCPAAVGAGRLGPDPGGGARTGSEETDVSMKEAATLLLGLPWELVHDGESFLFEGARGVRVRRRLPNRRAVGPLVTAAPVRVLLVSPRPEDERASYIDHRVSARPLVEALEPLGDLAELTLLTPPTLPALEEELLRARKAGKPYHVVHFDGHGVYDRRHGLGGPGAGLPRRRRDPLSARTPRLSSAVGAAVSGITSSCAICTLRPAKRTYHTLFVHVMGWVALALFLGVGPAQPFPLERVRAPAMVPGQTPRIGRPSSRSGRWRARGESTAHECLLQNGGIQEDLF